MGILPMQFKPGDSRKSLGLKGDEIIDIALPAGVKEIKPSQDLVLTIRRADGKKQEVTVYEPAQHGQRNRVLQERRHSAVRAEQPGAERRLTETVRRAAGHRVRHGWPAARHGALALATFEDACRAHGLVVARVVYDRCIGTSMKARARSSAARLDAISTIGSSRDWSQLYRRARDDARRRRERRRREILRTGAQLRDCRWRSRRRPPPNSRGRSCVWPGLLEFFAAMIGGDAVANAKPHPEPYLPLRRALGSRTESVLGDRRLRQRRARGARRWVVGVPGSRSRAAFRGRARNRSSGRAQPARSRAVCLSSSSQPEEM